MPTADFSPIRWRGDALLLLDQTRLPVEETWLECRDVESVARAIERLSVRGAPAIGVAAAYGLAVGIAPGGDRTALERLFSNAAVRLRATRPTAVNLGWALDRGREAFEALLADDPVTTPARFAAWAEELQARDVATNRHIAATGAPLFSPGDRVLTHCNAGALATAGIGTAVGVIAAAHLSHGLATVWVDETRPLLQGARLTTWELGRLEIPHRLVTDSSAGLLMSRGLVDRIVVGADRIAANGDVANKIGTYTVAVLAARHGVPFYVAAPLSTIDPDTSSGSWIPIEERSPDEVTSVFGTRVAPEGAEATNWAFDVTPADLVRGIITEVGVLEAPYEESIARALRGGELRVTNDE